MRTAVIGAGPAGITAAYRLTKAGITVDLYEASGSVGGLAKTIDLWGMKADIGPHRFFSHDTRINSLWLEVVKQDYSMVQRLTRIYYRGRFFHYPLRPVNTLGELGFSEAARCMASFAWQRISPVKLNGSFENWVVQRFGKRLYEIFFKTYSEKLWGISCAELDDDFAAQRIKKLSLAEAVSNAVFPSKKNSHHSLVDTFAFPSGGSGMVYNRMAEAIREGGNRILLNTPVARVVTSGGQLKGIETAGKNFIACDRVISSMPINQLVARLDEAPEEIRQAAGELKFRNAIMVYLLVEGNDLFPDNWMYIHSPDLKTGRITNFRNWSPAMHGGRNDTILMMEYWCYPEEDFWNNKEEDLVELAMKELKQTGLAGSRKVLDGFVLRIPKCYPVYRIGYRNRLKPVEQYLRTIKDLQVIGRFGAFKYNNQDHSMLMGLLAAENITMNANHDLWAVNTDYDDYQERSVITEEGLVKAR